LLRADRIVILSPWISDIEVEYPISSDIDVQKQKLTAAFRQFPEKKCTVVINEDSYNEYFVENAEDNVEIVRIDNLHAKAIVTDDLAYVGSANITRNGVGENVELARILENDYGDTEAFVEEELSLEF